ncbi:histone lysine methyltransferase Set9 [Sorochytrium milnesiophthora]
MSRQKSGSPQHLPSPPVSTGTVRRSSRLSNGANQDQLASATAMSNGDEPERRLTRQSKRNQEELEKQRSQLREASSIPTQQEAVQPQQRPQSVDQDATDASATADSKPDVSYKMLSLFDDIATYVLVDSLFSDLRIYKMTPTTPVTSKASHAGQADASVMVRGMIVECEKYPVDVAVVRGTIRRMAAKKLSLMDAVDRIVASLLWLTPWLEEFISVDDMDHFRLHFARYLRMYLPLAGYEVMQTLRYMSVTNRHEAALIADRDWALGDELKHCTGYIVALTHEQEQELLRDGRDFSVMHSSRKDAMCLFLGPARLVNHDCDPNVQFVSLGRNTVCFRVIKPIKAGDEITTNYGDDYFDYQNKACLCETCAKLHRGAFTGLNGTSSLAKTRADSQNGNSSDAEDDTAPAVVHRRAKQTAKFNLAQSAQEFASPTVQKSTKRRTVSPDGTTSERLVDVSELYANSATPLSQPLHPAAGKSLVLPNKVTCSICRFKVYTYSVSDVGHVQCHKCLRHQALFGMPWPTRVHPEYLKLPAKQDKSQRKKQAASKRYVIREDSGQSGSDSDSDSEDDVDSDVLEDVCTVSLKKLRADRRLPVFVPRKRDDPGDWWHVGIIVPEEEHFDEGCDSLRNAVLVCLFDSDKPTLQTYGLDVIRPFHHRLEPFVTYARLQPGFLQSPEIVRALQYLESGVVPDYMQWFDLDSDNDGSDLDSDDDDNGNDNRDRIYRFPDTNVSDLRRLIGESGTRNSRTSLVDFLQRIFCDAHGEQLPVSWTVRGDHTIRTIKQWRRMSQAMAVKGELTARLGPSRRSGGLIAPRIKRPPLDTILNKKTGYHAVVDEETVMEWETGQIDNVAEKVVQYGRRVPDSGLYASVRHHFDAEYVNSGVPGSLITDANERQLVFALDILEQPVETLVPAMLIPLSDWESLALVVPEEHYPVIYLKHSTYYPRMFLRKMEPDTEPYLSWSQHDEVKKSKTLQLCELALQGCLPQRFPWPKWRNEIQVLSKLGATRIMMAPGIPLLTDAQQGPPQVPPVGAASIRKRAGDDDFDVDDVVLCVDAAGIKHRAKITKKVPQSDGSNRYHVHFNGWQKRFDEWVDKRRLLVFDPTEVHQDGPVTKKAKLLQQQQR